MKKLMLIKRPEVFQGERYLKLDDDYFEGWYFKVTNGKESMAFIPGISISKGNRKAFIQVISNDNSYYVDYDIEEFDYGYEPFYVKVGNSYFSKDRVYIDIGDEGQDLVVKGEIRFDTSINIDTSICSPNIMGPFSYVPFMECNHAVISMRNRTMGVIAVNDREINYDKGIGYIEKDWGSTFPRSYMWGQGNCFRNKDVAFMISMADVHYKFFSFRGLICSLIIEGKEYRFATYNGAKIVKYEVSDNGIIIILKRGKYWLEVVAVDRDGYKLKAPVKGEMTKEIVESISSKITVTFKYGEEVIFEDSSFNCGLEVVLE